MFLVNSPSRLQQQQQQQQRDQAIAQAKQRREAGGFPGQGADGPSVPGKAQDWDYLHVGISVLIGQGYRYFPSCKLGIHMGHMGIIGVYDGTSTIIR